MDAQKALEVLTQMLTDDELNLTAEESEAVRIAEEALITEHGASRRLIAEQTSLAVVKDLKSQHIPAAFERPGYIGITLPNGSMMSCSDANEFFGCDIADREGVHKDAHQSTLRSDTEDSRAVSTWIASMYDNAVRSIMADGAGRWQCPECGSIDLRVQADVVVKLIQPADGAWTTESIQGSEHCWSDANHMECANCEYEAIAFEFEVKVAD